MPDSASVMIITNAAPPNVIADVTSCLQAAGFQTSTFDNGTPPSVSQIAYYPDQADQQWAEQVKAAVGSVIGSPELLATKEYQGTFIGPGNLFCYPVASVAARHPGS